MCPEMWYRVRSFRRTIQVTEFQLEYQISTQWSDGFKHTYTMHLTDASLVKEQQRLKGFQQLVKFTIKPVAKATRIRKKK